MFSYLTDENWNSARSNTTTSPGTSTYAHNHSQQLVSQFLSTPSLPWLGLEWSCHDLLSSFIWKQPQTQLHRTALLRSRSKQELQLDFEAERLTLHYLRPSWNFTHIGSISNFNGSAPYHGFPPPESSSLLEIQPPPIDSESGRSPIIP